MGIGNWMQLMEVLIFTDNYLAKFLPILDLGKRKPAHNRVKGKVKKLHSGQTQEPLKIRFDTS